MKIIVTGASGFVGSHIVRDLEKDGHDVLKITRQDLLGSAEVLAKKIDFSYALINLAGAPISKRWTRKHKREIYTSRIYTTRKIIEAIKICKNRPEILLNASAIGIYDTKHSHHEESRFLACDYLSKVIRDWEHAANISMEYGVAACILRFGIVLGKDGGIIKKISKLFRFGLGGKIGNGKQKFSFIHIDDISKVIISIIQKSIPNGVYNVVAPDEQTNASFTKTFSKILGKPAFLDVPKWVIKIMYGEGSDVIAEGQFVLPGKLIEKGFQFKYPDLHSALKEIANK